MKILTYVIWICISLPVGHAATIHLVIHGSSNYQIVLPEIPDIVEVRAAKVLQDYIYRISGATLPIVDDNRYSGRYGIWIGRAGRFRHGAFSEYNMTWDGYLIRTVGDELILAGGEGKGVLYATYTFLDKYLGCRKFSAEVSYVPRNPTITLEEIHDIENPAFAFRETYYHEVWDAEYMDWHKLNSVSDRLGVQSEWGLFVHTFGTLLNPEIYGEEHPEYFSYFDGKRHAGMVPSWDGKHSQPAAQLCLSNPEVLEIVCENLKKEMEKKPEALYWSVSQNDNVNYCRCEGCVTFDSMYAAYRPEEKLLSTHSGGSYSALGMGSLLTFINKVADRFPDKIISTLAYQYTRVPPKGVVPRQNVNIMLCSIESTRNDPIVVGDQDFRDDLIGWGKLTRNIFVWDYVIRFSNLLAPFPNLDILQPNLQFFHENGVSMVFEQGNRDVGGEFAELRSYLLSRMLWNPYIDFDKEMNEFLKGFYGEAADDIKAYIDLLHHNNQSGTQVKMSIFGSPIDDSETFLSQELRQQYKAIFERAIKKVENSPEFLERVLDARLPVLYADLEITRSEQMKRQNDDVLTTAQVELPHSILHSLYEFYYQCVKRKVSRVTEWHTTPAEYTERYLQWIGEGYGP